MDPQQQNGNGNGGFLGSMQPPPMMNPPPQIFGAYDHDGLPMGANMVGMDGGNYFGDGMTTMDESSEAKRRRIARVCCFRHSGSERVGEQAD